MGAVDLAHKLPWSENYEPPASVQVGVMDIMRSTGAPVYEHMFSQGEGEQDDAAAHFNGPAPPAQQHTTMAPSASGSTSGNNSSRNGGSGPIIASATNGNPPSTGVSGAGSGAGAGGAMGLVLMGGDGAAGAVGGGVGRGVSPATASIGGVREVGAGGALGAGAGPGNITNINPALARGNSNDWTTGGTESHTTNPMFGTSSGGSGTGRGGVGGRGAVVGQAPAAALEPAVPQGSVRAGSPAAEGALGGVLEAPTKKPGGAVPELEMVEAMGQEDEGAGVFGAILHEPGNIFWRGLLIRFFEWFLVKMANKSCQFGVTSTRECWMGYTYVICACVRTVRQ